MNNPYADIPGPEWDPNSEMYLRDPGSNASSLLLDIGVAPTDGATYRGLRPPPIPEGVKGRYVMTGVNQGPNQQGRDGSPEPYIQNAHGNDWVFMGEQEQAAEPASMEQALKKAVAPTADPNGKTIYNDWDLYQATARTEPEANLNSPGVLNQQDLVGLDRRDQMSALYPAAWQTSGIQKVIGPNGTNIAPDLENKGLFAKFRENNIQPSDYADFPSMMDQLLKAGKITQKEHDFLGDLTIAKKPDQSFAMPGMQGGGGLKGMMGFK